jgi:hypothetical protein
MAIPERIIKLIDEYIAIGGDRMLFHSEVASKKYRRDNPELCKRADEIRAYYVGRLQQLERVIASYLRGEME